MMIVVAVLSLAVGTFALKAVGPVTASGRELPPALDRLASLLPAALLAGLVATQTFGDGASLVVDARVVGVGAGLVAVLLRAPFPVVVVIGAAAAALTRALGWG
jgi:branched-subunit amino acid transport protein